jgi:phosphomannomutase
MFNYDIFRSYDIRGVVPDEFDPEEAYHIGRAYAEHTGAKRVAVGYDMRKSSLEFVDNIHRGLTDAGVDVVDIGLATTPMLYFAVHELKTDGGLMVTASHNPGKYNGVKMTRQEAVPIGGDTGMAEIRDLVEKREWKEVKNKGNIVEDKSLRETYLSMVCEKGLAKGLKIVVDAGNGMAGVLLDDVFKRIGGEVVPLFWEPNGDFPNHEANPLEEKNMKDLNAAVKEHGADLGVAFDGDADRVFFSDETGKTVPCDLITALIAQEILKKKKGATILYDLRSSRATKEAIEEAGGVPEMTRVGHSNIKADMRKMNAVFAGEVSGHFYFVPWYAESGMLAMMYMIRMLQETGKSVSELIKPLERYAKTPEINYEVEDKATVLKNIKNKYADADILELDGVTVSYADWWANVRTSNTEPLLRLNLEAKTPELLKEKQEEIEAIIKGDPFSV